MSQNKTVTVYLRGTFYWAKIFGAPRPNYNRDAREWTFEFEPDEDSVQLLTDHGLRDRIKDNSHKKGYEGRKPFLNLKRKEFRYDGEPNDPIRVVDASNGSWPANTLIGNGTIGDVKVNIVDYGPGKKKGIYPQAIRVLDLVAYESKEFAPIAKDDPYFSKVKKQEDTFKKDFGLEDDDDAPEPEAEKPAPKRTRTNKKVREEDLDDDLPFEDE